MSAILRIHPDDNVAVAIRPVAQGEALEAGGIAVTALEEVPQAHKIALRPIAAGENIIKYGFPIGHATQDIPAGGWVHTHNTKTNLGELLEYRYHPTGKALAPRKPGSFLGYRREDGRVGIRNEVWIIPTVGCVNHAAQMLAQRGEALKKGTVEGVYAFPHPYGCSQMGDDHAQTQKLLAGLVNHPNAGAVLVLGLGCENNQIEQFRAIVGENPAGRIAYLECQSVPDELEAGEALLRELIDYAAQFQREPTPTSELVIGLKCGGSDGFSGITANPLVGALSDRLIAEGGSAMLTEVPEMFGAETLLMDRCKDEATFEKTVHLINDFKQYYIDNHQVVYENPSPGNKKGGITTLEDKSLGCTQKGGTAPVTDVLGYGERIAHKGLNLVCGPGNDLVAATTVAASGAHLVLFTTGRGTPFGCPVPTVKVSSNTGLFERKPGWIDFNAGQLVEGRSMEELTEELYQYVLALASGKTHTRTEEQGIRDIAIFKRGVIL